MGYRGYAERASSTPSCTLIDLNPTLPLNPETGSFRIELRTPNQTCCWDSNLDTETIPTVYPNGNSTSSQQMPTGTTEEKCFQIRFPTVHNVFQIRFLPIHNVFKSTSRSQNWLSSHSPSIISPTNKLNSTCSQTELRWNRLHPCKRALVRPFLVQARPR